MSEIAARLELHRSAVQRALDRLERLALHDDEGIGRRRRDPASAHGLTSKEAAKIGQAAGQSISKRSKETDPCATTTRTVS